MHKLKAYPHGDGFEIVGNREGLRHLAEVCLSLSNLPEDADEAQRVGNHHHFADYMITLDDGATPFIILYKPDL